MPSNVLLDLSFFPDGGEGCHPKRKQVCGGVNVSLRRYYKFLNHERPKELRQVGNNILQDHRILQDILVMAFIREKQQKLRRIKQHQRKIRAESYQTLKENIQTDTETGDRHGKRVIYLLCIMEVLVGIGKNI